MPARALTALGQHGAGLATEQRLHVACRPGCARQVLTSAAEFEMWGDGKQTRSFTFIDDCIEGVLRITKSDCREPLNLG